ncbi:HIRAN domain-containing protein [Neoaquamicrobium sediminum]|uniref:HIRAN domain-containing protein n=1 Tax=Neoaquamicrobium sediminum TaxID=1849104 RepID=A0ABV3WXI1_9HYPH
MGLFDWLLRPKQSRSRRARIMGSGQYDQDIVGEANYQDALNRTCGGKTEDGHEHECSAQLFEEPTNKYDSNAVKVTINGRTVGYLSRADAVDYKRALASAGLAGRAVDVDAIVVGGWDRGNRGSGHYGVKLDMEMPPEFD